ncbi:bifunctional Delta(1)-pyrroline-2-carboxylate/Delta(1)-piperideine-2-carboxylate reductase [Variovorax ureilyticus]|uniref:bifunctional Delta(1)-pyrroline-2-carboxylate/Delta(1)-piperideine-2- carboxylate reductase n=1 Tax=Variovorax ureilyticus TaxID=1836198 RepID=UPI003D667E09
MESTFAYAASPSNIEQQIVVLDKRRTAELLDFEPLVDAIAVAAAEYEDGKIHSPERMVVPLGESGVLLSMPATAADIGIHKLVNVQPANAKRSLPTIHGTVTVCETDTGKPICLLDGPEVTGRRTAAVTLLAIRTLLQKAPREVLLIGTGAQARYHVRALHRVYPGTKIWVRGLDMAAALEFCDACKDIHGDLAPAAQDISALVDVVITLTTSTKAVYDEVPTAGRLVIGVGAFKPEMAELGKTTLDGSDIYADDPAGARHEAGDLLQAGIDWSRVHSLQAALKGQVDRSRPFVFKSVGTAAWDLAAARVALRALYARSEPSTASS